MARLLRRFSVFGNPPNLVSAPGLQGLQDYYLAVEQLEERNFDKAAGSLQTVLNQLSVVRRQDHPSFTVAATLMAKTHKERGMFDKAEALLKKVVERLETQPEHQELYTRACLNLFIQYLHTNAPEAVNFGSAMLEQEKWTKLQPTAHADWHFLHGTALALMGADLAGAKREFDLAHALDNKELRPYMLNNLACAQWWHLLEFKFTNKKTPELKQVVKDFEMCLPNLQRSLACFEGRPDAVYSVKDGLPTARDSHTVLCNIAEVLSEKGGEEAMEWWVLTLSHAKKYRREELGRIVTHLADMLMREDKKRAEGVLKDAYKSLNEEDCRLAYALEVNIKILAGVEDRQNEMLELSTRLETLNQKLLPWAWPALHLYIPEWHII